MNSELPNSRRGRRDVAIMLGVIAVIAAILFSDFIFAEWYRRNAEREIIDLANKIPDNATREQVVEAFAWGNYNYLNCARTTLEISGSFILRIELEPAIGS